MTLCIAIVTPRIAIHVSDRRVVWKRENEIIKTDDERNKAIIDDTGDIRIIISYCGLAELNGKPTDLWIAETLAELAKFPHTLGELLYIFPKHLSEAYVETKKAYKDDVPLEITWSGFSVNLAFQAIFANIFDANRNPVRPNQKFFHIYDKPPDFPMKKGKDRCFRIYVSGSGATTFVPLYMKSLVYCGKRGNFKPSKADWLVRTLVDMIRHVAADPKSESSVGGNCMSCILSPRPEVEPSCKYYPQGTHPIIYAPIFLSGTTYVSIQLTRRD